MTVWNWILLQESVSRHSNFYLGSCTILKQILRQISCSLFCFCFILNTSYLQEESHRNGLICFEQKVRFYILGTRFISLEVNILWTLWSVHIKPQKYSMYKTSLKLLKVWTLNSMLHEQSLFFSIRVTFTAKLMS